MYPYKDGAAEMWLNEANSAFCLRISERCFQLPGAEEAFRINPPLYTKAPSANNFGIEEERPGLTLIENKHGLRNILRKKPNFSQECQVRLASSHLCTLSKGVRMDRTA